MKKGGYSSGGRISCFMRSLTEGGATSYMLLNNAKKGERSSSRDVFEIDSVSSGMVFSIMSIIRWTTFASECGGNKVDFDGARGRLSRPCTTFVRGGCASFRSDSRSATN